ncbi:MAG: transcription termination factor NusA [Planctomycetes bacterium]|nr:transcription termination factor NusA [Planctomycetota bacterium]
MNSDLLRIVDAISRDKNIDKDSVFEDLELAMVSAANKSFGPTEDCVVVIDRLSGEITASYEGEPINMKELGRIAAQTAKQVMIQRIREAERGSIYEEFSERVGTIVTGTVARYEGSALIINLGRTEGFLPRSEQIPGESSHHPGERVRSMVLDVREAPNQVRIVLTRSHPDFIRRLFELEVPEVAEHVIELKALAREAGYRTKVAVSSIDTRVDAVGACVGVRGSRIRNIVDELGGEKIDIVRWNESSQILIGNALKPAEVQEIALCFELGRATVVVSEDQLSLAIGKRGQNVRLAARLTGWDIDILTPAEYNKGLDDLERTLKEIDGVDDVLVEKVMTLGLISVGDVAEVGTEPLVSELELEEALAQTIVDTSTAAAKRIAEETAAAKALAAEAAKKEQEDAANAAEDSGSDATESEALAASESGGTEEAAPQSEIEELPAGEAAETAKEKPDSDEDTAGDSDSDSAESEALGTSEGDSTEVPVEEAVPQSAIEESPAGEATELVEPNNSVQTQEPE